MKLSFDIQKGYSDVVLTGKTITKEDYIAVPIIKWLIDNVGPIITANPGEILHGDGWEIYTDWDPYWIGVDGAPQVCVIIKKHVDDKLLTKFWMKFQ
jgi:hypothetical protein